MTSEEYVDAIHRAIGSHLTDHGLYAGREGHLRLANEMGQALPDFTDKEQRDVISASYGSVYVRGCFLKPILSAKEWVTEMKKGKEKAIASRKTMRAFWDSIGIV